MFQITLKFLEAVKTHNTTERMHTHWDLYQQEKKRFQSFIGAFLEKSKAINPDLEALEVKDCIFRFNRDTRFSKDPRPYKENFGAVFAYGGKKSDFPCFYFHLAPGTSFFGGGIYMPFPSSEIKIRTLLLKQFHEWERIITTPQFRNYYGQPYAEHTYKTTYKLKQLLITNPELPNHLSESLRYDQLTRDLTPTKKTKQAFDLVLQQVAYQRDWIFAHSVSDELLCEEGFLEKMLDAYHRLLPILRFFDKAYW